MDGHLRFTPFSAVFQSYQDDGQIIMKGCVQWNPFTGEKISVSCMAQIVSIEHKE